MTVSFLFVLDISSRVDVFLVKAASWGRQGYSMLMIQMIQMHIKNSFVCAHYNIAKLACGCVLSCAFNAFYASYDWAHSFGVVAVPKLLPWLSHIEYGQPSIHALQLRLEMVHPPKSIEETTYMRYRNCARITVPVLKKQET